MAMSEQQQGLGGALPSGQAFAATPSSPQAVSPVPASIPSAEKYVLDASMGMRGGCFCFCPVELDEAGEISSVVIGMSYISNEPPGALVAIIHEDGQEAVEEFCEAYKAELAVLASAIEARRAETAKTGSVHESADPKGDAQPSPPSPSAS